MHFLSISLSSSNIKINSPLDCFIALFIAIEDLLVPYMGEDGDFEARVRKCLQKQIIVKVSL